MHKTLCPVNNNLYAACKCDELNLYEHTEQLREFNQNIQRASELNSLVEKLIKTTEKIERMQSVINNIYMNINGREKLNMFEIFTIQNLLRPFVEKMGGRS